jgi:hypothetical protein
MLSTKSFRFVRTLHILSAVLPICGLQLYGQRLDPRIPPGVVARAVAARTAVKGSPAASTISNLLPQATGTFITFDPPGSGLTDGSAINPAGEIAGFYFDASGEHGYLRDKDGTFTIFFNPPNPSDNINVSAINPSGVITGNSHIAPSRTDSSGRMGPSRHSMPRVVTVPSGTVSPRRGWSWEATVPRILLAKVFCELRTGQLARSMTRAQARGGSKGPARAPLTLQG